MTSSIIVPSVLILILVLNVMKGLNFNFKGYNANLFVKLKTVKVVCKPINVLNAHKDITY